MTRLFALLTGLALAAPLTAQTDVEWKIRREAKENSQILSTLHMLSDRSDHTSFNEAGLPGIGMGQDPIEYGTHSWHTNLDAYERVVVGDAMKSATVIASAVYYLAMRDELLPRFTPEEMPEKPEPPEEERATQP